MRTWTRALALFALVGVVAGCGGSAGQDQVVELDALRAAFGSNEITVEIGRPVTLLLHNKDREPHDFVIDRISVSGKKSEDGGGHAHGGGPGADLHVGAEPGTTGTLRFTPKTAGSYSFYCSVPGHKESGMVGTLIVG